MGALHTLQQDVAGIINAIPEVENACHVHRFGDIVSATEAKVAKLGGRAVTIELLGFSPIGENQITFTCELSIKIWTTTVNEGSSDHASMFYYDDLAEAIAKALHFLKYPTNDEQCSNHVQITNARLLPTESEQLKAFTVFELIAKIPFELIINNKNQTN